MHEFKVMLFDDNRRIRDSLSMLINATEGYTVCGAYESCDDILIKIEVYNPDVILMDIDMPGLNGIEAVKLIRENFFNLPVVMQTVFDDDEKIFQAICAGASGYILKNSGTNDIIQSIEDVLKGGAPLTPSIAKRVLFLFQKNLDVPQKESYNLTKREKEVLTELVDGKSYKMIANGMQITYDTVRAHIKKIYEKLHVASMTEAVAIAIKQKLT